MLHHSKAELTELRGWEGDLGECQSLSDLPDGAREYLQFIEDHTKVPIALVGVGAGRDQVIWTDEGRQTIAAGQGSAANGDTPAWERV